jgi:hypothetical protein
MDSWFDEPGICFPAHFVWDKRNSGRGGGLIYSVRAAVFQILLQRGEARPKQLQCLDHRQVILRLSFIG